MNRKQLITLWLLGLWCVFAVIIAMDEPSRHQVSTLIKLVVPALIIGFLFFISFKKGLLQSENYDPNKVIYKTTKLKAFLIGFTGFFIGAILVGLLSFFVFEEKNSQIASLMEQIQEQKKENKDKIIGKDLSALLKDMEWKEAKVLSSSGYSAEIQLANNNVISITVPMNSFINEIKKGDTLWLRTNTKQVKLGSGKIYEYY